MAKWPSKNYKGKFTADDFRGPFTAENFSSYSSVLKSRKNKAQEAAADRVAALNNRHTENAGAIRDAYGARSENPKPVMPSTSTPSVTMSAAAQRAANREANAGAIRSAYGARQFAQLKDDIKDLQSRINNSRSPSRNLTDELQKMQDQYAAMLESTKKNASVGQIALNSAMHGLSQFNKGMFSTLDFILPTELLGEKYDFVSKLNERYANDELTYSENLQKSVADRSKAAQVAAEIGSGTVAALPNAILAIMTGGTALGAEAMAAPAASSGVLATAKASIQQMMKNPQYWTSLAQTLGTDYEEAKENGASEIAAIASAFISSMLNAGVEIGGGIETLPSNLKTGGKNAVLEWVKSALEEGREEAVQSVISRLTQKAIYAKDKPLFSVTDDTAVFNPINMGKEFALGAAVGGILGGGQILGVSAINAGINRENARALARGAQNAAVPRSYTTETENAGNRKITAFNPTAAERADNLRRVGEFSEKLGKAAKTVFGQVYDGTEPADLFENAAMPYYRAGKKGESFESAKPVNNGVELLDKAKEMLYDAGKSDALALNNRAGYTVSKNINSEVTADEIHLRDSSERPAGENTRGQVRIVEESAGRDPRRQAQSLARDSGAAALTYGEEISTASYGIEDGATDDVIYRIDGETESMREAKAIAQERGLEPIFFGGGDMTVKGDAIRGYLDGNRVYVRVDDPDFTAEQIMRHEAGHDMIRKNEVDINAVRERIDTIFRERGVVNTSETVSEAYAEAYAGSNLSADEIWEEVICDSLADMNIFAGKVDAISGAVGKFLDVAKTETLSARTASDGVVSDTGGKASRNKRNQTYITEAQVTAKQFESDITEWDMSGRADGERFILGSTGDVLQGLGAIESDIYINSDKINVILAEHPDMSIFEIKKLPQILNDPVVILQSRNVGRGQRQNTRLVMFGTVRNSSGAPVLAVLDLRPVENDFVIENMQKVSSAYTKNNPADFVRRSFVLFADKNRTPALLRTIGFHMPIELLRSGSIGSISYSGQNVNLRGVSFSSVVSENGGKASRTVKTLGELQQENTELKKQFSELRAALKTKTSQAEYWKGQTKRTEEVTARQSDVNRLARQLVEDTLSTVKAADISERLKDLADIIVRGDENAPEWVEVKDRSIDIARELVTNAQELVNSEDVQLYNEIKKAVRGTRIALTDEAKADIPDFNDFRKRNFGRITLASDGVSIDEAYSQFAEEFGEGFFPTDITAPADQIIHIAETLQSLQAIYNNPFDFDMAAAIEYTANDILRALMGGEVRTTAPTYADKQAAKIDALKKKNAQKVKELRANNNRKALRQKIIRHTKELSKRLRNPTDKKHVPDEFRKVVATALEAINLGSAFDVAATSDGKTKRVPIGTEAAQATERTRAFRKLRDEYAAIVKDEAYGIGKNPDLLGVDDEPGLLQKVTDYMDTPIDALNIDQLNDVWTMVRALEHAINTAGKMLSQSKYERTSELVSAFKADAKDRRSMSMLGGGRLLDVTDPLTFFSRFGNTGKEVFRILRNAQDAQTRMTEEVADKTSAFITAKQVAEARKERHFFTTESGQKLVLTTAQIMDLYNLARRDAAKKHLAEGGIRQPEIKRSGTQKRIPRGTKAIPLTLDDIANIVSKLSVEYRNIAEGLQKLMANELAEWGNEASRAVFGYSKFNDKDYWTIRSAHEEVETTAERNKRNVISLKNQGFTKSVVPNAANGVNLDDAFNVFNKHAVDMIRYSAWLAPVEDVMRFYNFKDRSTMHTVKDDFVRVAGDNAQRYFENLMNDIQNGIAGENDTETAKDIAKIISRGKGAAVGANLRVVFQQPTAIVRASNVLNPVKMARGLKGGVLPGRGWTKARKWAAIAQMKSVGGFDQGNARSTDKQFYNAATAIERINDFASKGAELADAATWGALWNACEWEVAKTVKPSEIGETAFLQKTAELFTDVVEQTQVVDGVLQRSQIMRSGADLPKMASAFMGEPIKALNMFFRAWDAWRYTTNPTTRKAAGKKLARTVGTLAVTNAINAFVQSLVDAARDDDKEKTYRQRVLSAYLGEVDSENTWKENFNAVVLGNLGSSINPINYFPYIKDVMSVLEGFEVVRADADVLKSIINTTVAFSKALQGEGNKTVVYAFINFAGAASAVLGIPVKNLTREVLAGFDTFIRAAENYALMYEFEKFKYRVSGDGNASRFIYILYKAKQGEDAEVYEHIYSDLIKRGLSEKQIRDGMERLMKEEEDVKKVEDLSARYLTPDEQRQYDKTMRNFSSSAVWGKATSEQRKKATDKLYSVVVMDAAGEKLLKKIEDGAEYGIDAETYILYDLACDVADATNKNKDERNKSINQDESEAAVEMLAGLSEDAKEFLWALPNKKWADSKNNPYK